MPGVVKTDDEFSVAVPPLRLSFRWDGRRWRHELDAGGKVLASSLEWDPERDDPARVVSPAYQQLSSRETEGGAQAMLVGMWGRSHGSAVFTLTQGPGGVAVDADVAVRGLGPGSVLAATYLVDLTSSALSDAGPAAVVWDVEDPCRGQLRFEAGADAVSRSRVGLAEAGRRATRVQATAPDEDAPPTRRLVYRWRWVNGPDTKHGPTDKPPEPSRTSN